MIENIQKVYGIYKGRNLLQVKFSYQNALYWAKKLKGKAYEIKVFKIKKIGVE